jgi:hypothetical protein
MPCRSDWSSICFVHFSAAALRAKVSEIRTFLPSLVRTRTSARNVIFPGLFLAVLLRSVIVAMVGSRLELRDEDLGSQERLHGRV